MKKQVLTILLILLAILFCVKTYAQNDNLITLSDGSVLKGTIVGFKDGVYRINTAKLGEVEIEQSDIVSIVAQTQNPSRSFSNQALPSSFQLKNQALNMQNTIMQDKDVMQDVNKLISNEEVRAILSDPKVMESVLSFDAEKMLANEKLQKLLNSPEMQQLMREINNKYNLEKNIHP